MNSYNDLGSPASDVITSITVTSICDANGCVDPMSYGSSANGRRQLNVPAASSYSNETASCITIFFTLTSLVNATDGNASNATDVVAKKLKEYNYIFFTALTPKNASNATNTTADPNATVAEAADTLASSSTCTPLLTLDIIPSPPPPPMPSAPPPPPFSPILCGCHGGTGLLSKGALATYLQALRPVGYAWHSGWDDPVDPRNASSETAYCAYLAEHRAGTCSYSLLSHAIREGRMRNDNVAPYSTPMLAHAFCDEMMLSVCTCEPCPRSPPLTLNVDVKKNNDVWLTFSEAVVRSDGQIVTKDDFLVGINGWGEYPDLMGESLEMLVMSTWTEPTHTLGRRFTYHPDMVNPLPNGTEELLIHVPMHTIFGADGGGLLQVDDRLFLNDESPPSFKPLRAIHSKEYRETGKMTDDEGNVIPIGDYTLLITFTEEVWGTGEDGRVIGDDWMLEVQDNLANISANVLYSWIQPPPSPPPAPPPPLVPCLNLDTVNASSNVTYCANLTSSSAAYASGRRLQSGVPWWALPSPQTPSPYGTVRLALDVVLSSPQVDGMAVVYFMGPRVGAIRDRAGLPLMGVNEGSGAVSYSFPMPPFVPTGAQDPVSGNTINPSDSGLASLIALGVVIIMLLPLLAYLFHRWRVRAAAKKRKKELEEKLSKLDELRSTLDEALGNNYGPSAKACVLLDKALILAEESNEMLPPCAKLVFDDDGKKPKLEEPLPADDATSSNELAVPSSIAPPLLPPPKPEPVTLYDPISKRGMHPWQMTILKAAYLCHQERELAPAKNDRDALELLLAWLHEASTPLLQAGPEGGGGVRCAPPPLPPVEQIDKPRPPVARALIDDKALPPCVIEAASDLGKQSNQRECFGILLPVFISLPSFAQSTHSLTLGAHVQIVSSLAPCRALFRPTIAPAPAT